MRERREGEADSVGIVQDMSEEEERSLEMMKDPSLPEMKLTEREMRVPEVEEEVVAEEASEVVEDLEVVSEEEVAEDSEEVLVVKAVLDHLGLKKHHKPIFFIHHHQLSLASYFQHRLFQLSQPRNSNYFLLNTKNIVFQFSVMGVFKGH